MLYLLADASTEIQDIAGPDQGFLHAGKWPLLFLFFGLIVSFVFVRINTRLIRKQVSWWPGNIESGDVHVHHVVIGFILMVIVGILEFALQPDGWTQRILALLFGMGLGVSLDEFALIFHLEDVYWKDQGRKSIDAVVIVAAFIGMLLVGLVPLGISEAVDDTPWWVLVATIGVHSIFVLITLVKGKIWWGLLGIFIPVLAWIAAVRLARPNSPWAHWFYKRKAKKMARAKRRAERYDRTLGRFQDRLWDLIGGRPGRPQPKAGGLAIEEIVPVDGERPTAEPLPMHFERDADAGGSPETRE